MSAKIPKPQTKTNNNKTERKTHDAYFQINTYIYVYMYTQKLSVCKFANKLS